MRPFRAEIDYYAERAEGLLASARDGTATAVAEFERHGAPLTADGARLVLARQHGEGTWEDLQARVAGLADDPFAAAYQALEARDVAALEALLDAHPDLVEARGTNGNDLLGIADDDRLTALLLARGADVQRGNVHGWTPLHQAAYGNRVARARLLLEAGARVDVSARGDGGTPLVVALFWGHREVAELLAGHGAHPRNLRVGAGLGDLDLVEDAGAHRGFYRPHSGFPPWEPSDDPQEVLDEALSWAARSDRADVLEELVARGARPDADVYRGTAMAWAAMQGRVAAIRRLGALGADPDARGADGVTPLHLAAQSNRLDVVHALRELGADPSLRDTEYGATAAEWADHFGHAVVKRALE